MAPGRKRDEQKERQWRRWIALWQRSGLSVAAFCARHRLATATFYAWRQTLKRRDPPPAPLVPVHLVADDPPTPPSPLEVVLHDGRVVPVAPRLDPATLRQLLAVLREGRPC